VQLDRHLSDAEFEQKEDELEALYLNEFSKDLGLLKKDIKAILEHKEHRIHEMTELLERMQAKVIDNELYALLYNQSCAELLNFDRGALDNKVMNIVVNAVVYSIYFPRH